MAIMNFNWQQMPLLSKPNREDVRIVKIEALADELIGTDDTIIQQMIKIHRLNSRETELLMELLQVNYILDVRDNEICKF